MLGLEVRVMVVSLRLVVMVTASIRVSLRVGVTQLLSLVSGQQD